MRIFAYLFLLTAVAAFSQDRGSIPEELLRPRRGEAPRYPVDIVIGELGRGNASAAAFGYANSIAQGFLSGSMNHSALVSINAVVRESHISVISGISPVSYRIGGGRAEADGAISFLVRFIGREKGITGELYIRYVSRQILDNNGELTTTGTWTFDELLLEEPKDRYQENQDAVHSNDFYPYERFF
ncbi:MAG: hypothetical protein FWD14_04330 [Treponema sp.]|nr:hypothetical protein [Treponema sp.]